MSQVRVRIAPSPTGTPHVGTAYIALFNFLFARSNGGSFILRIEDTDRSRSHPEYEEQLLKAFRWIGLSWDEGPDIGGNYGPYRQSERSDIYKENIEKLLADGHVYRCFCTPERLEKMRAEQRARKENPQYDRKCLGLTESEVRRLMGEGVPFVVRLKTPDEGVCVIKDRLRGEIETGYDMIDDQVLIKSDGMPTYHMANVVDDHLMGITHVIRGEEWISSTPKHLLLYEKFGWEPPEFIHMPLLLNPDGSKLSKRKNPTSILYYREAGFFPEALINFLGLMGYSSPGDEEKTTLEEMVANFDIDRISPGGSVFDIKKLIWLNGRFIRENMKPEELLERLKEWRFNDEFLARIIPLMHPRMEILGDFLPKISSFYTKDVIYSPEEIIPKGRELSDVASALQCVLWSFEGFIEWSSKNIEASIKKTAEFLEWPIRDLTQILFVAVMGARVAPPLFESLEIIGRDISRARILSALNAAEGISRKQAKKLEKKWINFQIAEKT